jgi:sterol desaturase/sphingolipid hydroxylase (fatty acid hydroxylase superfamily)
MQLSNWGYHADFVVYPPLILAVSLKALWHAAPVADALWLSAVVVGTAAWTLIEYAIHRWILHRMPPFKRLHAMHHARPAALIGTPTWLSALLFMALWAALDREIAVLAASGLAAGLMAGYLGYAVLHFVLHHRRASPGSWLHAAKLRHARHHRDGADSDYGVSTGVWDRLFGTAWCSRR